MTTATAPVWPLVTVDIDGTLTTVHGWKVLSAAFGRSREFARTQRRFFRAAIGEDVQAPFEVRSDKPGGLRALAARNRISAAQVVHIGDGRADAALFGSVGRGVALNSSFPDVERAADLALHSNDFRQVAAAVEALRPRG